MMGLCSGDRGAMGGGNFGLLICPSSACRRPGLPMTTVFAGTDSGIFRSRMAASLRTEFR
jgi:hypothetical protein